MKAGMKAASINAKYVSAELGFLFTGSAFRNLKINIGHR
jgi:hypothetical protein